MTEEELKKYTVDFMNNETGLSRSNIDSVMGKMLIKYAEIFQKRIAELESIVRNTKAVDESFAKLQQDNAELKENYFYTRCIGSNCPYIHKVNRNCTKFGGFFTAVSNGDCPMMKNLNANIKLDKAKELLEEFISLLQNPRTALDTKTVMNKAKQFLSEDEK